mgnify:CR=1 FL=1
MSGLYQEFSDGLRGDRWQPALDVFETDVSVVVRVEGELLRVNGVRRVPSEPKARRLHRMEIAFGPFEREVRISLPFDREGVSAHLEDGFLTITLPKRLPRRRRIEVE